jgi:hypothetical protein
MDNNQQKQPGGVTGTGQAGNVQPPHPGKQPLQWDDVIVLFFALLGFAGSVVLYGTASAPPIIISFFLATGVSSLVYRFLGGIQGADFAWGTLRVGGTLAALAGIAVGVNQYLEAQSLFMISLEGRYEWQVGAGGWKGYINVEKDGSASIYMQRYLTCGGELKSLPLLQQSGPGKVEGKQGRTEMHVSIPVQFFSYDANCKQTGVQDLTVLAGDLVRTPAFAGTIEYRSKYGVPLGGMIVVKDSPATIW